MSLSDGARAPQRAMAIDAIDFDRGARLGIEIAVAVAYPARSGKSMQCMPFVKMDIAKVDGLVELLGVVKLDGVYRLCRAQVPLRIVLIKRRDRPSHGR